MSFLSHIFISLVLVVQGFFGYGQATSTLSSTSTDLHIESPTTSSEKKSLPNESNIPPSSAVKESIKQISTPNDNVTDSLALSISLGEMRITYDTVSVPVPDEKPPTEGYYNFGYLGNQVKYVDTTVPRAYIEWNTNIPTNSKIFLTPTSRLVRNPDPTLYCVTSIPLETPESTQVVSSASGNSTIHYIDLNNLKMNYQYTYVIEAIAELKDQKVTRTFNTSKYGMCPTN